jgi:DNA repair protein RecO (recombination protein O)
MDQISTKAIPLHTIKYSDSALIARLFTRECGLVGVIVRGGNSKRSNKRRLLAPFSLLHANLSAKSGRDLMSLTDLALELPLPHIHSQLAKSSLVMFLSEVLLKTLEEHYVNHALFDFVWDAIQALDQVDKTSNFHLWFLIKLSEFYGFAPHPSERTSAVYFDLVSGEFCDRFREKETANVATSALLATIAGMKFDRAIDLKISNSERKALLDALISYYGFQISGLKEINSHHILETVLND